jgi:hypothetical protein
VVAFLVCAVIGMAKSKARSIWNNLLMFQLEIK